MREFILTQRCKDAENAEKISGCLRHGVWGSAPASITSAHSAPLRLCVKTLSAALITFLSVTANALPLTWRADWPGSKPVETLVHRGTDIEFQPQWYINGELANSTNWTFQTFVQTNAQATGEWFGPLPGAAFSHTNDIGAAFYNVMVRAQMPGGGVNYTAFARLRMLDSPGYTPGELPLPVSTIDFSKVVALNAPWLLPDATNATAAASRAYTDSATNRLLSSACSYTDASTNALGTAINNNLENNYYTASETDDAIDALAAYYITYTAAGAAFATYAALTNATVYYSAGSVRVPTRNDYCVVLADETHGGAEWRYIYAVADGATTGQWEAQYPIETNDYEALSNKPQINGNELFGNKTGAQLGLLDLSGGTITGELFVGTSGDLTIINPTTGVDAPLISAPQIKIAGITIERTGNSLTFLMADGNTVVALPLANTGTAALVTDISAAISPTSPAFSNAVLSVGLGIDTNTVAVINELVDSAHDLPVTGATSVGALFLALAAAVAALKKRLPYAISASIPLTVTSGAASTTLDDRTHNVRTVAAPGSGNTTTITATLPPIVAGKSRDMFLNLTVGTQASDAGDISLSIVEPSGETVQIDIRSVEDIGVGENEIMIFERALPTTSGNTITTHWLVTVRHEDFAS